jgi:hypothetical protein
MGVAGAVQLIERVEDPGRDRSRLVERQGSVLDQGSEGVSLDPTTGNPTTVLAEMYLGDGRRPRG